MARKVGARSLLNPASRAALAAWAWNHRHEVLRWGRSLWNEVVGRRDVDPARALRTGRVLLAIASDPELRNAPELRRVTMREDMVDLEVDPTWEALGRLVDRVQRVEGVSRVVVNSGEVIETTARDSDVSRPSPARARR